MKSPYSGLEDKAFLLLLVVVSLVFGLILWSFSGAILWGVMLAVVFAPLNRRLCKFMRQRRTLAAVTTEIIILVLVILPLMLVLAMLVREGTDVSRRIESGELNLGQNFQKVFDALPDRARHLLERFEPTSLGEMPAKAATALTRAGQFLIAQAIRLGQNTFSFVINLFVMLYLLFFLLRDGDSVALRIRDAIPLRAEQRSVLIDRLTAVIRATIKGNVIIALWQGALFGLLFWILGIRPALLWAALMATLSFLPAVGPVLVWAPAGIYLLVTGSGWRGIVLLFFGSVVNGMADYVLRPFLVGKDTYMPNYLALISTLGGIAVFGVNGFIIGPLIAAMFLAAWEIFSPTE